MIQEQKELLLKDLCARLPYGVIVETPKGKGRVCNINFTIFGVEIGVNINPTIRDTFSIDDVKPYLCPILSMTEEQQKDLSKFLANFIDDENVVADWYNKNHFDYRGLIFMELANDATDLNIY